LQNKKNYKLEYKEQVDKVLEKDGARPHPQRFFSYLWHAFLISLQAMAETYIQDKTFDGNDFSQIPLTKGEYENCIFTNCNFTDKDLSDFKFIDCTFKGCNLSLVKLNKTAFRDVKFKDCKMLGLRFDTCNEFGLSFSFDGCQLNHSSFYKIKIQKTIFKNSQLQETDFVDCDLNSSVFENCDLTRATFENANIEKADFRTSYNYSIDPEINQIKKAKFSILGVSGLLDKYDIDIEQITAQ
jgi:fluoroquinolone resistance protein